MKVLRFCTLLAATLMLVGCMHRPPPKAQPLRLLCAGQSNMAYTVARAEESGWTRPADLARRLVEADIRFATIARNPQVKPASATPTSISLERVTNETASDVSVLCLFSALEVAERAERPVEFIVAAVGGSSIETWLPVQVNEELGLFNESHRAFFADPEGMTARWQATVESILNALPAPSGAWSEIAVPGLWENQGYPGLDGVVWLETQFEFPGHVAGKPAGLSLGEVDDWDTTFLKGCRLGSTYSWDIPRRYEVPAACIHAGTNTLRVRVVDTGGGGGMRGAAADIFLSMHDGAAKVPLSGQWRLAAVGPLPPLPAQPGNDRNTPSLLYNGMIAPLALERFDAVIWYQGESNAYSADRPAQYSSKLTALVAAWRRLLADADLPFFVIQLPEFDPGARAGPFAFGNIRLGQFLTAEADPTVTLVPALGLGTVDDIHPPDKTVLASRVADALLGASMPLAECRLVSLRAEANTEPMQVERCDSSLDDCQRVESEIRIIEDLSDHPGDEERTFVIGRANVPSRWFSCQSGAVSAQRLLGPRTR